MFTGLIQDVGTVVAARGSAPLRLTVETALRAEEFALGESVALDGVCLTVIERGPGQFSVEASKETLERSTLSKTSVGQQVHLERALAVGERLGGHLVLGHVDGVGQVVSARDEASGRFVEIEAPPAVSPYLLEKGSIAVDGVSLTINGFSEARFSLFLIPETLRRTRLSARGVGARVNLEADVIGKYVSRLLGARSVAQVDEALLRRAGFA
ncbi:MAG: riboflavin synthase [Deltaproteobacteria bacterium]